MTKPTSSEAGEGETAQATDPPPPAVPPAGADPPRTSSPMPPQAPAASEAAGNPRGGPEGKKASNKFKLRWDSYSHSVLAAFRRLKEEEDFVDVTLACNSKHFNAHKVILSACSPYFRQLLKVSSVYVEHIPPLASLLSI